MPIFTQFLQADCQPFNKFLQMYTRCSIGPTIFKKMNSARFQCLSEMCAGPSYQPLLPPLLSQTIKGLFSQFITFQPVENIQSPQSQQLYPVGKRDSRTWWTNPVESTNSFRTSDTVIPTATPLLCFAA
ncbi:unnamed protein product [Gadus morhua 'NCC']